MNEYNQSDSLQISNIKNKNKFWLVIIISLMLLCVSFCLFNYLYKYTGIIDIKSLQKIDPRFSDSDVANETTKWQYFSKKYTSKIVKDIKSNSTSSIETTIKGETRTICKNLPGIIGREFICNQEYKFSNYSAELSVKLGNNVIFKRELFSFDNEKEMTNAPGKKLVFVNYGLNNGASSSMKLTENYYQNYINMELNGDYLLLSSNPGYTVKELKIPMLINLKTGEIKNINESGLVALSPDYKSIVIINQKKVSILNTINNQKTPVNLSKDMLDAFNNNTKNGYTNVVDVYWNKNNRIIVTLSLPGLDGINYDVFIMDTDGKFTGKKANYKQYFKGDHLEPTGGKLEYSNLGDDVYTTNYLSL